MHAPLKLAAATLAVAALALTSLVATPQPAQAATTSVDVSFNLSRTTLSDGRDAGGARLTTISNVVAAPKSTERAFTFTSTNSFGTRDNTLWERSAVYQLETLGKTTGYWIEIVMAVSGHGWQARCNIYAGDPGTPRRPRAKGWNCDSDSRDSLQLPDRHRRHRRRRKRHLPHRSDPDEAARDRRHEPGRRSAAHQHVLPRRPEPQLQGELRLGQLVPQDGRYA